MLQQTTVVAVIPYFERFLDRFPTVHDLAAADENEVLRLWEGLGYYSRARNLRKAANEIVKNHEGRFPADVQELQNLPGIGRYTAGAIASFAFDQRAPIVEANTLRLYARLLGYAGDPRSKQGQETLWSFAEAVLPAQNPGQLNQAMMELGATICSPKQPACADCPVAKHCRACAEGTQSMIPTPAVRPTITELTEYSIVIHRRGKYLLRRCSTKERWAGLWDFIRFELPQNEYLPTKPTKNTSQKLPEFNSNDSSHATQIVARVKELTGLNVILGEQFAELKHSVTRYRITLKCVHAEIDSGSLSPTSEWQWILPEDLSNYALSVTGRKISKRLAH